MYTSTILLVVWLGICFINWQVHTYI